MRPAVLEGTPTPLATTSSASSAPTLQHAGAPKAESASFGRVLRALGDEIGRGEALVERAAHAGSTPGLAPADLLALQAGIYRWVEVVDLTSKLVERATQAAKTVTQPGGG